MAASTDGRWLARGLEHAVGSILGALPMDGNPNVMYEICVRHRAREAGTAIFRQSGLPLPFDIKSIKAFPMTASRLRM